MTDYTRPPWPDDGQDEGQHAAPAGWGSSPSALPPNADLPTTRPPLPPLPPAAAARRPAEPAVADTSALSELEYDVVEELRDRVSTRLTVEDKNYPAEGRRELTKKLIRDEYDQWLLHEANRGRTAPTVVTEEKIFAAVLAELDGLGRLAPLLARHDVEDIHFQGCDATMLRLTSGELVPGPPIAGTDEELEQLLRSIGARSGDGQTSREFSSAAPILNVRLKGVTELGARLQAAMDVLPRPAGVIRVHRFSDPSLSDLRELNMIDTPMHAFLHHAILAGASPLISGNPGVGKTTLCRALGNTIPYNNVVIQVEDERELGLHLLRWDAERGQMTSRHAVSRSFESRLPNAEGMGAFSMGDALNEALRASVTWVVVGEVRGGYVTALLDAATSGIASVMCTIHSRSADGIFKKVKINALKADPTPDSELIMDSLSELDLVIHVHRDHDYNRYVSGIYELGEPGDSGKPSLTPIFKARRPGERPVATGPGALSDDLRERLAAVGFNAEQWLGEGRADWRDIPRSGRAS
jgi:pilus assembly protein CpaF